MPRSNASRIAKSFDRSLRLPVVRIESETRRGDIRFIGDAKSGGIRWSPDPRHLRGEIDKLELGTINQIKENMKEKGATILADATSNAKWQDHPERHRPGGLTATGRRKARTKTFVSRWTHNLTAREGMFVYVRQRGSFIELGLSHSPSTIYVRSDGQRFNYGVALETGFGGRFAIIAPTLAKHHRTVMNSCTGALTKQGQVKPKPNFGGQQIASGWLKQAGKGRG
jgi:hypothetical protein